MSPRRPETLCVHSGTELDHKLDHGQPIISPLNLSTTFALSMEEPRPPYEYSRVSNPSRSELEEVLAGLEGAKHAICFSSGCAASSSLIMALKQGDHVVMSQDVYGGTFRLAKDVFSEFGIETSIVDLDSAEAHFKSSTRLLWAETPSNPLLTLVDIKNLGELAKKRNAHFVIDNTFATPLLQRPLDLGATVSLHSVTKYLNGHSDVLGGVLLTNDDVLAKKLRFIQKAVGAVPSPFDCYQVRRGIKTLSVRLERQVKNAEKIAEFLEPHKNVARVYYPGLKSHPQYELAKAQMKAPGAMISFEIEGGLRAAKRFFRTTTLFPCAFSLGAVESLSEHPATMTHACLSSEARQKAKITDGLIRLSVGIESVDDLISDLNLSLG